MKALTGSVHGDLNSCCKSLMPLENTHNQKQEIFISTWKDKAIFTVHLETTMRSTISYFRLRQ